ncbi:MAG: DUF4867 family protein [Treponema sp.]|nr:DUF4867 family protein [Treponema sp.]
MLLRSVYDKTFNEYGIVLEGYDFKDMIRVLENHTEKPVDRVIYVPSDSGLEMLPVFKELENRLFGGLSIQAGYCNGYNTMLNCLEYHRGSEAFVAADDLVLLLARKQELVDFKIDTSQVEAYMVPKGTGLLYYETTLHYAPAKADGSFRSVILLPRATNTKMPEIKTANKEDKLLFSRNKWLIAHSESPEAKQGAVVGLMGKNIDIRRDIQS